MPSRSVPTTPRACSASRARSTSTSSWSAPSCRSCSGWPTRLRRFGYPRLRAERGCRADRRVEGVREGGHGGGGSPDRSAASDRATAVRHQGGRARGREGRLSSAGRRPRSTRRCARCSGVGGRRRRRGAARRARGLARSRSATGANAVPLASAQDFKRAFDGDYGPEHRRDGRLRARARRRRRRRRVARRTGAPTRPRRARAARRAVRRACSTPA